MTIILENISKIIDGKAVLQNFNAEIEWGKCYGFVGPVNSGKSAILQIFMGTESPDSGKVCRMGDYKYPTLHSAYVSQHGQLNLKKNAIWNVKKAHRFGSKTKSIQDLSKFLSEDRLTLPVSELTDVERRFVEIVRASFMVADFIVLDEPFEGMDDAQKKSALDFILNFRGSRPLLITSKNDDDVSFANKIYHL